MSGPDSFAAGFEVPLHRSLTEPILMGGAPRTVAIANGTLAATVQAMVNSAQHAGGVLVRRSLAIEPSDGGVRIVVADDGNGFDIRRIPPERLGLEVSIRERVALAGGEASIESVPGHGTTVELRWAPEPDADAGAVRS